MMNWIWLGFVLVLLYFTVTPFILMKTVMKDLYKQMGLPRFSVMVMLVLLMASLPIKMVLRWLFNLKYIVAIPEAFFNI